MGSKGREGLREGGTGRRNIEKWRAGKEGGRNGKERRRSAIFSLTLCQAASFCQSNTRRRFLSITIKAIRNAVFFR